MRAVSILKHLMDVCPFRVGQTVRVRQGSDAWRSDWRGVYVITGIRWEYQRANGQLSIELATDDEIERGYGATDDFRVDDLEPVT